MDTLQPYIFGFVILWVVVGLAMARSRGIKRIKRFPLIVYVVGVPVVWGITLGLAWLIGGPERVHTVALVGLGFALGMIAMYIATRVYRS